MIGSFADRDTEDLFNDRSCPPAWRAFERIARRKLFMVDIAGRIDDLRVPLGNRLERLRGDRDGFWSIRINNRWRVCFAWDAGNAYDVEIVDYHKG